MHALTRNEAEGWCRAHGIHLDDRDLPQPEFTDAQGLDFKIPSDAGYRIALLHELFAYVPDDQELLLWFAEWGIWSSGERPHMFERFRDSYGEHRSFSEAPAYVFAPAEREDATSFAAFALLFLWDSHLLTATGDTWLFLSHDEIDGFVPVPACHQRTPSRANGERRAPAPWIIPQDAGCRATASVAVTRPAFSANLSPYKR